MRDLIGLILGLLLQGGIIYVLWFILSLVIPIGMPTFLASVVIGAVLSVISNTFFK